MKTLTALILTFAFLTSAFNQNLVTNSSFEVYSSCPNTDNQTSLSTGWIDVVATSDYYNCGYYDDEIDSVGHTGTGYMGVSCLRPSWNDSYREYVGRYLDNTLTANVEYYVEFWVKTSVDNCVFTDAFGALFTSGLPNQVDPWTKLLPYTPQVQNQQYRMIDKPYSWQKICGTFIANGTENFITLGSFKSDAESTFTPSDSSACPTGGYGVHWAYVHFDDILVTSNLSLQGDCEDATYSIPAQTILPTGEIVNNQEKPENLNECALNFPNVITPNGDNINDFIPLNISDNWSFQLMNRWGDVLYYSDENESQQFNGNDAFGKKLNAGTYFYLLENYSESCRQHGIITILR